MKTLSENLLGEFFGTLVLVFIGCGSIIVSTLTTHLPELWQVAGVWGIGVSIAIYLTRVFSHAHLNPAVTSAMFFMRGIQLKELILFSVFQLLGAMTAGYLLYLSFEGLISDYLNTNGYDQTSARMFGEFFPGDASLAVSWVEASCYELVGTFILLMVIFVSAHLPRRGQLFRPLVIGFTVSVLICWIAPYSQAGFNPARDFGPRLVSYFLGWKEVAFQSPFHSFFTVYIASPILGGVLAARLWKIVSTRLASLEA